MDIHRSCYKLDNRPSYGNECSVVPQEASNTTNEKTTTCLCGDGSTSYILDALHDRIRYQSGRSMCSRILDYVYNSSCWWGCSFLIEVHYSWLAGIAIFQVANTQFLYIATQQKRYTSAQSLEHLVRGKKVSALDGKTGSLWQRIWQRLQRMDKITRAVIYVSVGMVIQVSQRSVLQVIAHVNRLRLPHSSSWFQGNSIRGLVLCQLTCLGLLWKSVSGVVAAGNGILRNDFNFQIILTSSGGSQLYGNSSGPGYMHRTSSGNLATSKILMVGDYKRFFAV